MRETTLVPIGLCFCIGACASATAVPVRPEERVTLRVGQVAVIELPARERYSLTGSAGDSLVPVREEQKGDAALFVYRAVTTGNHTLLLVPATRPSDGCVSCVTVHYFVTVEP